MQYQGGKDRIGRRIAGLIEARRALGEPYVEPFIGGGGVFQHITGRKSGSDRDADLIAMWRAAVDGWVPPVNVAESQYNDAKAGNAEAHVRGFMKYACSWGGKPWGGFARSGARNYAQAGSRAVVRKAAGMTGAALMCADYRTLHPTGCVVYCDPPYAGTTGYGETFDSVAFWALMREWAVRNTVLVSEYAAPGDILREAVIPIHANMRRAPQAEVLFRVLPSAITRAA